MRTQVQDQIEEAVQTALRTRKCIEVVFRRFTGRHVLDWVALLLSCPENDIATTPSSLQRLHNAYNYEGAFLRESTVTFIIGPHFPVMDFAKYVGPAIESVRVRSL